MKKFTHWVFDLDGTIADSSKHYEIALKEILGDFNIVPTEEDKIRAYKYFNPEEYFATFPITAQQVKQAVDKLVDMNQKHADETPTFAGINELFAELKNKGVHISVWTGRELDSATRILQSAGLYKYIWKCVGRTCVQNNKPYPDGLLKILQDSGHSAEDVVMVGDHEYDMRGAIAAKVKGISVSWEGMARPEALKLSHLHFAQVQDLHNWVKNLYD